MDDDKIALVLRGFTNLSSGDQLTFINQLNEYLRAESEKKRSLREGFEKRAQFSLGPLDSGGCPCCGR